MLENRNIIIICGMHRSGTSAITGLLHHCGYSIGKNILPPSTDNKKGFFENKKLVFYNESLLHKLDLSWDSIFGIPKNYEDILNLETIKKELNNILLNEFADDKNIVIKDPRINILLPIYLSCLSPTNTISYVNIVREPIAVIKSLEVRNNFAANKSALIWLIHNLSIFSTIPTDSNNIIISFEQLVTEPNDTLTSIINSLNLRINKSKKQITKYTSQFIEKKSHLQTKAPKDKVQSNLASLINKLYKEIIKYDEIKQSLKSSLVKSCSNFINYHKIYEESHVTKSYFSLVTLFKDNFPFKVYNFPNKTGINTIELDIVDSEVNRVVINPTNKNGIVKLINSEITHDDEISKVQPTTYKTNYEHGIKYVLSPSSFFLYTLDKRNISKFKFEYDLIAINRNTFDELSNLNQEVNGWIKENISTLSEHNNNNQSLIKSLSKKIEDNNEILNIKNQIIYDLEKIVSKNTQNEKLIQDELELLNLELTESKREQNALSENIKLTTKKLSKLKKAYKKSKQDVKIRDKKLSKYEKELNTVPDLMLTIEKLTSENKNLKSTFSEEKSIRKNYEILEKDNKKLNLEYNELKNKITLLDFQKENLEKTISEKETTLINATKQIDVFKISKHEVLSVKKDLEFREIEINRLTNQVNSLSEQIKSLTSSIDQHHAISHEHKDIISQLSLENDKLNFLLENSKQKSLELVEVVDLLNNKIEETDKASEDMQQEMLNSMNMLHEKNHLLEEANRTHELLEQQIHQIQESKNQEIQRLNEKINNKEENSTEVIIDSEERIEQIESLLIEKQNEERAFRDHIQAQEGDIRAIKQSISYKIGFGLTSPARWIYDKTINKPGKKSNTWVITELAKRGLKNPARTIRQISPKNLSTLQKALKNEPSEAIVQNFDKLIEPKSVEPELIIEDDHKSSSMKQKILYISPHLPDYDTSSGGKRATRMISLLCEEFDVYIYTQGNKQQKYIDKLHEVGAIVIQSDNLDRVKKRIPNISTIIYAWYYTIFDCKRFMELYPSAKLIIDTVDVHWVREQRSIGIWEGLTQEKVDTNKKREIKAYQQADIIWTVTENDKQQVLKEISEADIRVVSNIHDNEIHEYEDHNKNTMLFIGGYNHYPNISAVKIAATEMLPQIRAEIQDATLIIAGSHATEEIIDLGNIEGVEYRGFIEDEDIAQLYEDSFISIAPLLAGAGIKGKICEAIMFRTLVATNSIGNEGIDLVNEQDGLISDDFTELSSLVINAMKRSYDVNQMTHNAQEKLKSLVGSEGVKDAMVKSILPEISICIVTWNRKDLVERCIQSIEGNTRYPYYKILVHSNGCTDGTQEYLTAAAEINKKIIPILSPDNEVFVKPNNAMMRMFPENDAVLVNNDVYVTEGWLTALYKAAYSSDKIGLAGSKILYPDNTLQEFGSELYEDGTGRNIGKWDDPDKPEYKHMKRVGYVSGCSLFIKKSTIDKIGVFDEQFHPCYCEDSDLCYTAWENDLETVVTPDSLIYHDEGGTSGTDENSGFKSYQKINFEKFLAKHRHNLKEIAEKIKKLN